MDMNLVVLYPSTLHKNGHLDDCKQNQCNQIRHNCIKTAFTGYRNVLIMTIFFCTKILDTQHHSYDVAHLKRSYTIWFICSNFVNCKLIAKKYKIVINIVIKNLLLSRLSKKLICKGKGLMLKLSVTVIPMTCHYQTIH